MSLFYYWQHEHNETVSNQVAHQRHKLARHVGVTQENIRDCVQRPPANCHWLVQHTSLITSKHTNQKRWNKTRIINTKSDGNRCGKDVTVGALLTQIWWHSGVSGQSPQRGLFRGRSLLGNQGGEAPWSWKLRIFVENLLAFYCTLYLQ